MAKDDKTKAKAGAEAEVPAAGKKKKTLLLIVLALVLLGGGAGGFFFWKSRQAAPASAQAPAAKPALTPLQFYTLDPPFVSNFEGMQAYRFLQIHVRLATRSQETLDLMAASDPILRNDLLLLFSAQNAEALSTKEGKDKLRSDALQLVRNVVKTAGGDPKTVESVLFTSFVMQ